MTVVRQAKRCSVRRARGDLDQASPQMPSRDSRHRHGVGWCLAGLIAAIMTSTGCSGSRSAGPLLPPIAENAAVTIEGDIDGFSAGEHDLWLVGPYDSPRFGEAPIGHIDDAGHFSATLPGEVSWSRLPEEAKRRIEQVAQTDPAQAKDLRERAQAELDTPQVAVHGLGAGESWEELDVVPVELNAARFGIVLRDGDLPVGDLIASNSDLDTFSSAGQQMLVWVYADQAGTVEGIANKLNAMYSPEPRSWKLELKPGWNAVTSESGGPGLLSYVTKPLDDDLTWRVVKLDP